MLDAKIMGELAVAKFKLDTEFIDEDEVVSNEDGVVAFSHTEATNVKSKPLEVMVAGPSLLEQKTLTVKQNNYGMYFLTFKEGGEIPDALKGNYTSIVEVKSAISNYELMQAA